MINKLLFVGIFSVAGLLAFGQNSQTDDSWAIGQAEVGEVLCTSGSRIDADGTRRVVAKPCNHAQCRNVMGIAGEHDHEAQTDWENTHVWVAQTGFQQVRVIGIVRAGDLLVPAGIPGYVMASHKPGMGSVVAKAMENHFGEKGVIFARIDLQSGHNLYKEMAALQAENNAMRLRLEALEARLQDQNAGRTQR